MAIVVEGEKRNINWFSLIIVVLLVAFLAGAIYYLFFVQPPLIEVVVPARLKSISELSTVNFSQPQDVLNSSVFQSLRQYPPLSLPPAFGRSNPFLPVK